MLEEWETVIIILRRSICFVCIVIFVALVCLFVCFDILVGGKNSEKSQRCWKWRFVFAKKKKNLRLKVDFQTCRVASLQKQKIKLDETD